jgi:hypothetical protein
MTASPIASRLHFATTAVATGPLLHYAEQGAPGGEALLFIHGWPDSWFSFSRHRVRPDAQNFFSLPQTPIRTGIVSAESAVAHTSAPRSNRKTC